MKSRSRPHGLSVRQSMAMAHSSTARMPIWTVRACVPDGLSASVQRQDGRMWMSGVPRLARARADRSGSESATLAPDRRPTAKPTQPFPVDG